MQFSTTKGEKKVSDLAKRLFDIKGPGSKETAKKAEAALLDANPHLKDLSNVAEGTPIVIPEVAPIKTEEIAHPLQTGAGLVASQLRGAIAIARSSFESSLAQETGRINSVTEALKSDPVKKLAAKDPALKEAIGAITDSHKARLKELDQLKTAQAQAMDELGNNLDALLNRFAGNVGKL